MRIIRFIAKNKKLQAIPFAEAYKTICALQEMGKLKITDEDVEDVQSQPEEEARG
jgi:hypothetical protein